MKSLRSTIDPKDRPPLKRIRLTIEWVGCCAEHTWADALIDVIEQADASQTTCVVEIEQLTHHGRTPRLSRDELRALGYKPREYGRGVWGALWWRLSHNTRRR